jgi:teichuronic acid exporter
MTLKEKTVNGLLWSFIDSFANQGVQFIIGIVLARLLSPREFGLIGMLTIFIAISQSFIDSGFANALIRKKDCTQADFSTVFFFNLLIGLFFYIVLFFSAPGISIFFKEPQLKGLLQVLGLGLIINSFTVIQQTILVKRIDFKLQTRISIISAIASGIIGIGMAYLGYGVWSLVFRTLTGFFFTSFLLWLWNNWKPTFVFSTQSFHELFRFGSKLLASGLIETAYKNINYFIIGKYFSAQELGMYTRADQFKSIPSQNITTTIGRVTYPVLASIQNDMPRLKSSYQKLIRSTMFISFFIMLGMAAVAKPMILTLIGQKWLPAVAYLQLLCFVGMTYPLHALNLNMLNVQGRSDLFLKLEIIKKILAVPIIILAIFCGIKIMICGMIVNSIIAYYLNGYWSGKMIGYSVKKQLSDIAPSFLLALIVNGIVFSFNYIIFFSPVILLCVQISVGAVLTIIICEFLKFKDYLYIKTVILEKIMKNGIRSK